MTIRNIAEQILIFVNKILTMKSTHWFCIYNDCILIYFHLVFVVNMEWSISETNRGKKSLLYDGFTYRIDSLLKSGDISWRCTLKTCKVRLRTV